MTKLTCPLCGNDDPDSFGTLEKMEGASTISIAPDGTYSHTGESEVFWDSSVTVTDENGIHVYCFECKQSFVTNAIKAGADQ